MSHLESIKRYGLSRHGRYYTEYGVSSGGWWGLEDASNRKIYMGDLPSVTSRQRELLKVYRDGIIVHEFTEDELEYITFQKLRKCTV